MPDFSHLHVHSQYSLLDGAASISAMYKKATGDKMRAIALTDHGNMFGAFEFVAEAAKYNKGTYETIKPIVGCEFYLVDDRTKQQFTRDDKDVRYHQLFLAKDETGYQNLVKLCSLGYIEGMYGKYPRIDKRLVEQYKEGLIATTCCLAAEVPRAIIQKGEDAAEKIFQWWLNLFGEDYYIELQRHGIPDQDKVNEVLLRWSLKYQVKVICSNDSHYVDQSDSNAHDILLCINTGEKQSTPKMKDFGDDDAFVKGRRFAFYNDEFYFKTQKQMLQKFSDIPQALDNTNEIVDKVKMLNLTKDILLPFYQIPSAFLSQDHYLEHITFEGAKARYREIDHETEERIKFELGVIRNMGFAGYFLIVADFIRAGRDMGVFIGPGRGSAAGSVVAYCIGITNIDPIKYNLLFERFLNPERKSMPDIDTDFDDEGRQKVIDYVINKYGRNQVAQIITYGTMAAKMSIKDVARVLDLPLPDANALAKLVPDRPGTELNRVILAPLDGEKGLIEKEGYNSDTLADIMKLRDIYSGNDIKAQVLQEAVKLEGSVRNTGVHAAGIIIAPKDLMEIIPVCVAKDSDLLVSQFEGTVIENAGVIKMDFLGLKTLTIIKDALRLIKQNYAIEIDIDNIPLDDAATYQLYQRGETNGTFQFESPGMQKYLKELKPDRLEDLIAMNALYRPGPLEYIPQFIRRKHKQEQVVYDLADMEEMLEETYGITVYQEQVMLLSQKLAGFSKGDADVLRKAMGKKQLDTLNKLKGKFMEGAGMRGHDLIVCEKVWTDWTAFASYAFNKSHSTCYAFVAYQTAYLKAHYPQEYMAAVLTHNLSNIEKVTFFMEECRRMGINVLGPDVNESSFHFTVNKQKQIRFGLGAVKGVGENAVENIIDCRIKDGPYHSIFELTERCNLRAVNKRTLEGLSKAGAFDCFAETHRAQYFFANKESINGLDMAVKYGQQKQESANASQFNLFEDVSQPEKAAMKPRLPECEPWSVLEKLHFEREMIGMYLSGHPLDLFRYELDYFTNINCMEIIPDNYAALKGKELCFAGIVTKSNPRVGKTGKRFGFFTVADLSGSVELAIFDEKKLVEYEKFLTEQSFVFVKAIVQSRFNNPNELELKVNSVHLLSEIGNSLARSITIIADKNEVDKEWLDNLQKNIENNKGKIGIKFSINNEDMKYSIEVASRKWKVEFSKSFFDELKYKGFRFKIERMERAPAAN
ncbi:MAG: DNA polymerase III subunit alpha [Bacteroidetes bacterium]|nr:DNA polymerase III subunit alpha [Bacteroidota bacterium]